MRLRGHHLLCLHGFRGLGYSPEFIANMQSVQSFLAASPDALVEVIASPDDICSACPHFFADRCCHNGEDSESRVSAKDRAILSCIGFSCGKTFPAKELFSRVANEFTGEIVNMCPSCEWLSLGWCAEGLQNRIMSSGGALSSGTDEIAPTARPADEALKNDRIIKGDER
jgi:uncharacterized protein